MEGNPSEPVAPPQAPVPGATPHVEPQSPVPGSTPEPTGRAPQDTPPDGTPEAPPKPPYRPDITKEEWLAYAKDQKFTHDDLKELDPYNTTLRQSIDRGMRDQTQFVQAHQQRLGAIRLMQGTLDATDAETERDFERRQIRFGVQDGQVVYDQKGMLPSEWRKAAHQADTAPAYQQLQETIR